MFKLQNPFGGNGIRAILKGQMPIIKCMVVSYGTN
jgi:hypothetical protein